MIRTLLPIAFSATLTLGACAVSSTVPTDAQLALTDGEAILAALEAAGKLPVNVQTDASLVIAGLQAVLTTFESPTVGSGERKTLAAAGAAVQQVVTDTSDPRVKQAGLLALSAVDAAELDASAGARGQVEAALGAVLLDYLATAQVTQTLAFARR